MNTLRSHVCKETKKVKFTVTEWKGSYQELGEWGISGPVGQRAQNFSYKMNNSGDTMCSTLPIVNNITSFVSDTFEILWTVQAGQVPQSMGFSRQEYWSSLPFPMLKIFPTQGSNPSLLQFLHCRQILYCWANGDAPIISYCILKIC